MERFDGYNRHDYIYPRTCREHFGSDFKLDKKDDDYSFLIYYVVIAVAAYFIY